MATTENPMKLGVFRDRMLAEQAVEELRHAGFRDDEIRMWGQEASGGGFFDSLFNKLSGQGTESEGISSTLVNQGAPQEEADYYQHEFDAGHSIVGVRTLDRQQEASDILFRFGAYNAQTSVTHDVQTIPLREEVLQARKRFIGVGELIIRKEIITEEKTITVTVQREEVIIERRSLSTPGIPPSDQSEAIVELPPGKTMRIPIREEQVFVEKRPVVIEELIISKRNIEETQQFSDTVRREVPHLERTGEVIVHGSENVHDET